MIEFNGGAKRSSVRPPYNKIPLGFWKSLALAVGEGEVKYPSDPDGTENWQKGNWDFVLETYNHLVEHVLTLNPRLWGTEEEDLTEDHVGHAAANLMFLQWQRENKVPWDAVPKGTEPLPEITFRGIPRDIAENPIYDEGRTITDPVKELGWLARLVKKS